MAVGGSTNAVLHLLAMAHASRVPLAIDDFETIRERTPVLCDLSPSGRYVTKDLHRAGGIPQVMKILLENGRLHGDCLTITGQTVAESLDGRARRSRRADQDVIRPFAKPLYPQGHLVILKGNLAPEGAVAKMTGVKRARMTRQGPGLRVRVGLPGGHPGRGHQGRRRGGDPLRGSQGRPRDARDAGPHLGHHGHGAGRLRGPHHRRPLLRRHPRHGGGSRGSRGRRGRVARAGEGRATPSPSTPRAGRCSSRWARTRSRGAARPTCPPSPATRAGCSPSTRSSSPRARWAR